MSRHGRGSKSDRGTDADRSSETGAGDQDLSSWFTTSGSASAAPPAPGGGDLPGVKRGREGPEADDAEGETADRLPEPPAPRGYRVRQSRRRVAKGWYAPLSEAALSTTRQAQILNTALIAPPTDAYGIVVGRDVLSNTLVAHDTFTAYEAGTITSPAVVVLGVIGAGKSSLLKTCYVLRPLILRGRRVVVVDKKDRGGEGEYCESSRAFGAEPLRFVLGGSTSAGGSTRINLLDPVLLADEGNGRAGQYRLLRGVAEIANRGRELDDWQNPALRAAHAETLRVAEADRRVPVLEDLLHQLGRMHEEFADYSPAAKERIHQAGLSVRHMLAAVLSDELAGLFDGPTSEHVRLADRLTVFDVSQLPEEGPAVSMVMTVANVWLLGTLRRWRGQLRTNFIAEEGWALVGGAAGKVFKANSKLARGLGLSNIAALHHVADIPEDDPAQAMLREAQTVHLYRQDRAEDIEAVIRLYGLDRGAAGTLANLPTGQHLLKIGNRREIHVEHVRSRLEKGLTNTDEAMILDPGALAGRGAIPDSVPADGFPADGFPGLSS